MPKRCNVLLETVKELPPLQVLEKKGEGLCHDRPVKARNPVGPGVFLQGYQAVRACVRHWCNGQAVG